MIRTLGDSGINWDWYLCADFNSEDKTCHIYYYQRWHRYEDRGSKAPKAEWRTDVFRLFELLEDDNRLVYGIKLEGMEYLVTNPGYIFDYKNMTPYRQEQSR